VNSARDVEYRLDLAKGFLEEAEEDYQLSRWRACVDNSQLSVENAGKAVLMLFGISPKTHDPARHLALLVKESTIPTEILNRIRNALPDFILLGLEEHFMTDYGDEASYRLPWEIFTETSASAALDAARRCAEAAVEIVEKTHELRMKHD
jgi:HEPN domain-containing protein